MLNINNQENPKIFYFEDNPGDVRLIREMLQQSYKSGYKLYHSDNIGKGITKSKKSDPDIILLDLDLIDSDGELTYNIVNKNHPNIPIIIISGNKNLSKTPKLVNKGAQDYLIKGHFDSNLLNRVIAYSIERKRIEILHREREERYRLILESIRDVIVICNRKELLYFNQPFLYLTKYSQKDLESITIDQILLNISKTLAFHKSNKTFEVELNIRKKKGDIIIAEIRGTKIHYKGGPANLLVIQDITQIKKMINKFHNYQERIEEFDDLIPICAYCKKIRQEKGESQKWIEPDHYLSNMSS